MSVVTREVQNSTEIPTKILLGDQEAFRANFNQASFQFEHSLADQELFSLSRLAQLAERLRANQRGSVRWQVSDAKVDQGWNVPLKGKNEDLSDAIANLDRSGSWILLYSVQRDPAYEPFLTQIMSELESATGAPLRQEVTWKDAYIFIASPQSVTPYHIDHESTFLFQIHGQRLANIWNQTDRSVLTDPELERYYAGDLGSAVYKEENQRKASVYTMAAGTGVHHPSCAPHYFKNGDTYSVALGVHFCQRQYDRRARVYQVNFCLRRIGLKPTPPGVSNWRDQVKIRGLGLFSRRTPRTKNEVIRSGFLRVTYPIRLVRGLKKKIVG